VSSTPVRDPRPDAPAPRPRRHLRWPAKVGIGLAGLVVLAALVGLVPNEPIRRSIESRMNASLKGYEARIGKARFQPIGLSLTLENLQLRQKSHPEPAILVIPKLHASVHWKELIFARVVADFLVDRPVVYVNLPQLQSEISDEVPVKNKGWQQALEAIYPLKINLFRIHEGKLTYVDEDPKRPLEMSQLNARATNIRNIHSKDRTYPSDVEASAVVFQNGRAEFKGNADFLAEPYAGAKGSFRLAGIPLDSVKPVAAHWSVLVSGGILSTSGDVEFSPKVRDLRLADVTLEKLKVGYQKRPQGAPEPGIAPASTKKTGNPEKTEKPPQEAVVPWTMRLDRFHLVDSELELVDKTRDPDYRLFVAHADVTAEGLSNKPEQGPGRATASGKFMGVSDVKGTATFRPGTRKAKGQDSAPLDFDVQLEVAPTPLPKLNDLFRAYGKFDVYAGTLQVYSEIGVHNNYMRGYVKPIFKDVEIYDPAQDANKGFLKKVYENAVDLAQKILTNRKRDQVATNVEVEGPVGNTSSSLFQVLGGLLENAFIRAILPGFDRQVGVRKVDGKAEAPKAK
jgi:hypothetical protein